jgi:pilus assembly protein CpaB
MGRRTILLVVAALVAVLGSGLVFVYVKGADARALQGQAPVQVLKAVARIEPGETLEQAQAAGKLELRDVPTDQVLDGALATVGDLGSDVALAPVFPNEQITSVKFGKSGDQDALALPDGTVAISVNLSDTGRVAGFVTPGTEVALFVNGAVGTDGSEVARLLLPSVTVVAVAQTTVAADAAAGSTDQAADQVAAQTAEQLPRTLVTLAVSQTDAERVLFASTHGELSFGLRTKASKVQPGGGVTAANLFGAVS